MATTINHAVDNRPVEMTSTTSSPSATQNTLMVLRHGDEMVTVDIGVRTFNNVRYVTESDHLKHLSYYSRRNGYMIITLIVVVLILAILLLVL